MKRLLIIALLLIATSGCSPANSWDFRLTKIAEDQFIVTAYARGSKQKPMDLAVGIAATICELQGYEYLESKIIQEWGRLEIRLHHKDGPDRIQCSERSDEKYIEKARKKLGKAGL